MIKRIFISYRDRIVLFIFPLALISINSNWIFTPVTNYIPDPWFYLGYFRYFYEYAPFFPSNTHYFVERLTWNIPGHYLHKIFPPLQANYILHLIVYYVASFSLYGTLHLITNRRTALIGALLMGSYPWFLRAVGWDYTDGLGIAQMLLLIYLITLAHYSDQWRLCFLLAGAVFSSLLITNLFWISYLPSWGVYLLVLNLGTKRLTFKQLVLGASYFFFGSIFTLVLGGLFYYWATGDYFFLKNSIRFSISLSSDEINRRNVRFIYGHLRPYWHVVPAIVGLIATWQFWFSRPDKKSYSFTAVYLLFVIAYGWLIIWHFSSVPLLIIYTYCSFIIPTVFLVLGTLLSGFLKGVSEKSFNVIIAASITLLILPFLILRILPAIEDLQGNIVVIAAVSLFTIVIMAIPKRRTSIFAVISTLSVLFYLVSENSYVHVANPRSGRDNFLAILSASEVLDTYHSNHTHKEFRLWFRSDENYDTFFSLAGLYLYPWGVALGNPNSRETPPVNFSLAETDILQDENSIVILSSNPSSQEVLQEANRSTLSRNAVLKLVRVKTIQQDTTRFFLYFTKVDLIH